MIAIKIQCGCGQKYAFDVEPVGGRMSYAVACPVCGADGTSAADAAIAQSIPVEAPAAAPQISVNRLAAVAAAPEVSRITAPPPTAAPRTQTLLPGQVDRTTAEREARAKIFWGDSTDEVLKFLMRNGFTAAEASAQVNEMFQERAAVIRKNGVFKIIYGTLMACIPVVSWFIFAHVGFLPIKIFAVLIMIGLYGAYQAVKGIIMVIAPKSEPGDVASQ